MDTSDSAPKVELLETIVANLPWFAAVLDRSRRFVWVNRCDPTLKMDQVLGRRVEEFCHVGSQARPIEGIEQAFERGEPSYYEALAYGRGDTQTWYGTHVIPLPDEGRVERVLLLSSDETPRRRALEQLERSERRFRGLAEHMPDWVFVIDRQHRISYSNRPPPPETGLVREELLGTRVEQVVGHDEQIAERAIEDMFESQSATVYMSPGVGDGRHWRVRVCPFAEERGEPRGLVIATDVTETVDVRRRLEENEVRLDLALGASGMGMWSWDARSGEIQWDERACQIFGLDRPPSDFEAYLATIHPEDRSFVQSRITEAVETKSYRDLPHRITQPGGETRWLFCKGRVLCDCDGLVTGIAGGVFDITETRELEAQLRQAQKLDAVGKLAGGVAHDFNNLLLVIEGGAELVDAAKNESERRDAVAGIKRASRRAAELTRQLLTFSRQQPLETRVIDVNELVDDLSKMLRRLLPETIDLELSLSPGVRPVRADRVQLEQLLVNLCVNARDAMPRGGRLVLETSDATLDEASEDRPELRAGKYAKVVVRDTGTGMPIEVRERVFEPFFTTKDPGSGTGLGLAIAYGVVRQHEGSIRVDSEPGMGSIFTVLLPSTDLAVEAPEDVSRRPVQGGTETILLAEDDDMVRDVVAKLLQRAGYRVLEAGDGEEALELFRRSSDDVDLLLLDCVMPRLGGWDTLRHIRRSHRKVPVIISSGHDETPRDYLLEGDTFWLAKPYPSETLLRMVRRALETGLGTGRPARSVS